MDKDKKIDDLIIEMRKINKLNCNLLESLSKEVEKVQISKAQNEKKSKEIDKLKKDLKNVKNELLSRKKEILRNRKHYETQLRRVEYLNGSSTNEFLDVVQKNQVLESVIFHLGKKFEFDGDMLTEVYKVVSDPNDDFLRCLIDSIKESHDMRKESQKNESKLC